MLHIGILAHSADGAALCFLEMVREAARTLGAHQHPEITLSILPMGEVRTPDVSPLPTLDSTRLLAHEAVAAAIAGRPPLWRGGPIQ